MAPEVLSKGVTYDSSADWFSFGCMLHKLLKGHSPFRQHKTRDKHEIDHMTLTKVRVIDFERFCHVSCFAGTGLALEIQRTRAKFFMPSFQNVLY